MFVKRILQKRRRTHNIQTISYKIRILLKYSISKLLVINNRIIVYIIQ